MSDTLFDYLSALYVTKGGRWYGGERVTQLEHALQCALLAEEAGASDALIAASLLHDLGHLLHERVDPAPRHLDDRHEYRPIHTLRSHFDDDVLAPIMLHVAAKRYLCAVDVAYRRRLSQASKESLALQGGPFTPADAKAFIGQPHAWDAVRLRTWDDAAKVPARTTPQLGHYIAILMRCARVPADTESET